MPISLFRSILADAQGRLSALGLSEKCPPVNSVFIASQLRLFPSLSYANCA